MYALILSLIYRTVRVPDLPRILLSATRTSSVVVFLIALSSIMSYAMVFANIPNLIADWLTSVTSSSVVFLLIMAVVLLIIGIPLDATPAVLIFTPIFLPIAERLGVHPLHLGIIMIMNLCIGLCTPPVGTCLFLGCGIAETTVTKVIRPILPFFLAMIATLLLCTFIPEISLWLPAKLGLLK